jgi:hypothetical protein
MQMRTPTDYDRVGSHIQFAQFGRAQASPSGTEFPNHNARPTPGYQELLTVGHAVCFSLSDERRPRLPLWNI